MGRVKKHIAQKRKQALKAGKARRDKQQTLPPPPPVPPKQQTPPPPPVPPTSAQKRKSLVTQDSSEKKGVSREHIIVVKDDIEFLVKNMACGECLSDELEITFTQHQIDTYYKVNCENGHVIIDTNMTRKPKMPVKEKYYPLTTMLVFCMMMLGVGYDGVSKILAYLSLKHFTEQTYIRTAKYLTKKATIHTDNILEKSRSVVYEHYSNKEGGLDNGMANVDVTFDGSWHKRGHKSNFGVAATVDVDLGLVLDYSVCSKLCTMCTRKKMDLKNEKITEQDYNTWYENHRNVCEVNFSGPSGGMEKHAAVELWSNTTRNNMMYRTFLSDGDSSAYKAVCELNNNKGPYGEQYKVEKAECINHVAKRLGTSLREKKKTAEKGKMSGRHKLTDLVIDHLQFYFQLSLKRKLHTSPSEMRDEILSTFYHCTSTDAKPQHQLCPKGKESWCFYNKAMACNKTPASHSSMLVYFHLSQKEQDQVKAVYDRLTTDEMMSRCIKGLTQNRNEHLHSRIWRLCPKHRNASPRMIKFATATAIANYNAGYLGSNFNHLLGIDFTTSMETYLKERDKKMDSPIRRKMRKKFIRKALEDYAAGGF